MGQLLDAIKLVVKQMNEANPPAAVTYGTVTATSPLSVMVDNRFTVSGDMLVTMRGYVAGEFPATHTHKIDKHGHGVGSEVELETNAETEAYIGLKVGEKVVLLRDHGGGRFVILGRL